MAEEAMSGKAGAIWRVEPTPWRTPLDVTEALHALGARRGTLVAYRDACARIEDHHGVQEAASDLREIAAVEATLRWMSGEREVLGY